MKYVNAFMFSVSLFATLFFATGFAYSFIEVKDTIAYGLISLIVCIVFGANTFFFEEMEMQKK